MMRASLRRTIALVFATLAVACGAVSFAQVAPVPTPPAAGVAPPSAADQGIHPDAVSSFQVRAYTLGTKKLWKGLLQVLEQSGYPPEEIDDKGRRVKTSFVDFNARDYSEAVADPPPRLGPGYFILQMNVVNLGKVALEGIVTKGEGGGSVLSLRARILVEGLDQVKRIRVLADRRSSGIIESDFMRRLEDQLGLERR
jgi:hypothetical protein